MAEASRNLAQRVVRIGANRLELLILEAQEERERLLRVILVALAVAALALLAGIALTLAIVVLAWEHSPLAALLTLTALYAGAAFLLYVRLNQMQRNGLMFGSTLDQLRKDREWLASNHQ